MHGAVCTIVGLIIDACPELIVCKSLCDRMSGCVSSKYRVGWFPVHFVLGPEALLSNLGCKAGWVVDCRVDSMMGLINSG